MDEGPMTLRLRVRHAGGHVHVSFFLAEGRPERTGTFAGCGELSFCAEEWPRAQAAFRHGGWVHVQKIDEGPS